MTHHMKRACWFVTGCISGGLAVWIGGALALEAIAKAMGYAINKNIHYVWPVGAAIAVANIVFLYWILSEAAKGIAAKLEQREREAVAAAVGDYREAVEQVERDREKGSAHPALAPIDWSKVERDWK